MQITTPKIVHKIKTITHYKTAPDSEVNAFLAKHPGARIINAQAAYNTNGTIQNHIIYIGYDEEAHD